MWRVELTYFKRSGKYYTSGEYESDKEHLFQIFTEVGEMHEQGKLPDLVEGAREFNVLIRVPDHPHDYPAMSYVKDEWIKDPDYLHLADMQLANLNKVDDEKEFLMGMGLAQMGILKELRLIRKIMERRERKEGW